MEVSNELQREREAIQFSSEEDSDCPEALEEGTVPPPPPPSRPICNGVLSNTTPNRIIDNIPPGSEGSESSSEDEGDDDEGCPQDTDEWKQEDGESISCECFICEHLTKGYEAADLMKLHIESAHQFSFDKLKTSFKLDYPGFVQFVRWARDMKQQGRIAEEIRNISSSVDKPLSEEQIPWISDNYLLPHSSDEEADYFLTLDFFAVDDSGSIPISPDPVTTEALISAIQELRLDKQHMVEVFKRVLSDNKKRGPTMGTCFSKCRRSQPQGAGGPQADASVAAFALKRMPGTTKLTGKGEEERCHTSISATASDRRLQAERFSVYASPNPCKSDNEMYFDSYNEVGIHHEMVFDMWRTNAYEAAIKEQGANIEGKLVLDVGCGSGILSFFCAQQNPKMVYGVDKSEIVFDAMSNCFENNFDSKIKFLHRDIDTEKLEIPSVDILISEFMGYFLFFEGMTETFIRARDKYLKPGGIMLPNNCVVELMPLGRTGLYANRIECWDSVYGFKMPALKARAMKEVMIETVDPADAIGKPYRVKELDLATCAVSDVHINSEFVLEIEKDADLCAVAGYFEVKFPGINNDVKLSTAPWEPSTHWKQAVFFLPKRHVVKAGQGVLGRIKSFPSPENPRWLVVELTIENITQKYEFR